MFRLLWYIIVGWALFNALSSKFWSQFIVYGIIGFVFLYGINFLKKHL